MTLVIDASVALAWIFEDEQSPIADRVLQRVAAEGAYVPSLWRLEIANVLWGAIRRKRCDEAHAIGSLDLLRRLQIAIDQETDVHAWGRTRELAAELDLTVYDAAYLELALRRKGVLATLDAKLAGAGTSAGLDVMYN